MNALILTGGKSARMGHDKSLINYHGKPQREYLFELLSTMSSRVYTSCKRDQDIPPSLNPLPDKFTLSSPLNGILSAFELAPDQTWITVPVDMPMIDEHVLQFLIDHRQPEKNLATCFHDSDGEKPEPLLAIWEPAAYDHLKKFYASGEKSPRHFLMTHQVGIISPPNTSLYENINTPEDLQKFRERRVKK